MTKSPSAESYRATLVPALHEIQDTHGYLTPAALREYSQRVGVPLYRLQAVASFFPHFRLSPPKKVTVRVCRDMACHLAGSGGMLDALRSLEEGGQVAVEGASCLGRCDRAPSTSVAVVGEHGEHYYHGRSGDDLRGIVMGALQSSLPPSDSDASHAGPYGVSRIDAYDGGAREYLAVRKVLAARDASLAAAEEILRTQKNWDFERVRQFRLGALRQRRTDSPLAPEVAEAVREW